MKYMFKCSYSKKTSAYHVSNDIKKYGERLFCPSSNKFIVELEF
jgi:hypothetical protein